MIPPSTPRPDIREMPAVNTEQMAEVDRLMIEDFGISLTQMMENAGFNLAEQARRMLGGSLAGRAVVVVCGAGNNGGGGMVAARHLHNRGASVWPVLAANRDRLKKVPAHQWKILEKLDLTRDSQLRLSEADLLVDTVIGYGLRGDPRPPAAGWIDRLISAGRPILSLDVPSGLDATSGRPGEPCVRATATMTLALPKTGLLAESAKQYVGELLVADIGVPPELYARLGLDTGPWFAEDSIVSAR